MVSAKIKYEKATNAGVLLLQHIFDYLLLKGNKIHNYTHYQNGVDYFFEVNACGTRAYMTGQGKGIKAHDYLILQTDTKSERYQVEGIDYYACPSDAWVAMLRRSPNADGKL